jgi:hypothetical protein
MCINLIKVTLLRYGLLPLVLPYHKTGVQDHNQTVSFMLLVYCDVKLRDLKFHSFVSEDSFFWDMILVSLDSSTRKCWPPT